MKNVVHVRPARESELATIEGLVTKAFVEGGFSPANANFAAVLHDLATQGMVFVAADEQSQDILGTASLVARGGVLARAALPGEGEVRLLAVDSAARGRGIGGALMHECLRVAAEMGLGAVVLQTQQSMTAAHGLYESLGFIRALERDVTRPDGVEMMLYRLAL